MTICIAITADIKGSPKIVFAADRMVSTDWVTYDSGLSKAQFVTEYAVIMTASDDILTSTEIMEKTINVITALNLPEKKKVEEIADILSKICQERLQSEGREKFSQNTG